MDYSVDFLEKADADINFDLGELSLVGINKAPYVCDNISTKHAALTVFPSHTPEKRKPLQTSKEESKASRPRLEAMP